MKNITNSTSTYLIALCSLVLLIEAGCKATVAPTMRGSSIGLASLDAIAPSSILSRYDTSNLFGLIVPREETFSIISHSFPASGRSNWSGTQSTGEANFIDNNGSPLNIGAVVFNKGFLNTSSPSDPSGDYVYSGNDLPIYTDGTTENLVVIEPFVSTNGSAFDSLTFGGPPTITNIVRGQNISRDSNITVNWTGTDDNFVSVFINVWDTTGMHDTTGHGVSIGGYFDNTGSATISLSKDQLVKGLADVELCKFEPKFITLSNGKRVAVIVETAEEITVHIVN